MDPSDYAVIERFAAEYVWWKAPDEALRQPKRVIAQVMNIGDYDDVVELVEQIGEDRLRRVLTHAEIGQFNERSWTYWHYRPSCKFSCDSHDGLGEYNAHLSARSKS
ncbi:MAG: hypothetical protein IPL99_05205 [Candidatus Competibacteraceae bacterium]|nr:hypothetical protein [Candidatus Competibacteraceae bacterium]